MTNKTHNFGNAGDGYDSFSPNNSNTLLSLYGLDIPGMVDRHLDPGSGFTTLLTKTISHPITPYGVLSIVIHHGVYFDAEDPEPDNGAAIQFTLFNETGSPDDVITFNFNIGQSDTGGGALDLLFGQVNLGATISRSSTWVNELNKFYPTQYLDMFSRMDIDYDNLTVKFYTSQDGLTWTIRESYDDIIAGDIPNTTLDTAKLTLISGELTASYTRVFDVYYGKSIDTVPLDPGDIVTYVVGENASSDLTLMKIAVEDVIGVGGYGTLEFYNKNFVDFSLIRSLEQRAIYVKDDAGVYRFRGNIGKARTKGEDTILVDLIHISNKLKLQKCAHNPILFQGSVEAIYDEETDDKDGNYSTVWGDDAQYLTMLQDSLYARRYNPTSYVVFTDGSSVDNFLGVLGNTYFDNLVRYGSGYSGTPSNGLFLEATYGVDQVPHVIITYDVWKKDGSSFLTADLALSLAWHNVPAGGDAGQVWIWNADTSTYEQISSHAGGTASPIGMQYEEFDITALGTLSDYFENITTQSGTNFTKHEVKIKITFGDAASNGQEVFLSWYFEELNVTFDLKQYSELGQGKLSDSTVSEAFHFNNSGPSWGIDDFPYSDGFAFGDVGILTPPADEVLSTVMSNADTSFILNQNITGLADLAEPEDLTDVDLADYLQRLTNNLNGLFYITLESLACNVLSLDNISDSALILDPSDFPQGLKSVDYQEDASEVYFTVVIEGAFTTVEGATGTALTIDDGDTQVVYQYPEITSSKTLAALLVAKILQHKSAKQLIGFDLQGDDFTGNFALVRPGLKVGLKLPSASDTNMGNFIAGQDEQLIIRSVAYQKVRKSEFYQVRTHKRFV